MKTNRKCTGKKDWQKADARILGQILAAQSIEFVLPDITHIAEFFAETLITIPGIMACRVCLEDVSIQRGEMESGPCEECQASRKKIAGQKEITSFSPDFRCRLADQPGIQLTTINSLHHHFGFFVFQMDDPDAFNIYKPFIGNLSNYVAISLENRLQRDLLQKAHDELELRVAERTDVLRASNETIKDLYDNAPCGYHSLDKDGFFILINDTELRWLGYSRDEIVGKVTFRDLLTANSLKTFEANFPGFKERGWVSDLEFEMVRKDGSILPVILNATAITDSDGNYVMSRSTIFDITERKRAEEALQESGMHYRQIVDLSQDMIVIHQQGKIVFINEAGVKLARASSPDQIIGRSVLEFVPPGRKEIAQERMKSILAEGEKSPVYEQKLRRLDGIEIDIDVRGMPIRYRGENAIQFVARDITGRKRAEEAQRRLNRELRAISDCNQILLRAVDEQTLLNDVCRIVCDEAGYRMAWVGYAEHDDARTVRPAAWAGVEDGYLATANITWADKERGHGPTGTAIRTGESACIQEFATDPKAAPWRENALQRGYRSSIALPLKDESARTFGTLTIYSTEPNAFTPDEVRLLEELAGDLAFGIIVLRARVERRQAEQSLRESEERFRSFVENANDIVYTVSPDGVFTYVSPNWKEMLGHEISEVEGRLFEIFVHPDDLAACRVILNRTIASGEKQSGFEYRVKHKNGSWQWHTSNSSVIRDGDGRVISFLGIARNITERKQAEEKVKQQLNELERWYNVTLNREGRVQELKREVNQLLTRLGEPVRYAGQDG